MLIKESFSDDIESYIFQNFDIDFHAVISLQPQCNYTALGGCRIAQYATIETAIDDSIRLSKSMTNKAIACNQSFSGGKAVIMRPVDIKNRQLILREFAKCVEFLQGRYITTIDSGTTPEDMSYIKQYTQFVTGTEESEQTYGSTSAATAFGVFKGIQAIADYQFTKSIKDLHIAIQGLGSVGYRLAKLLFEAGAKLTLCDINHDLAVSCAKEFNAHRVEPNDVYKVDCDIFSPCALGEIINTETVPLLQTKVIAGAANNQLSASEIVSVLHKRGIIYIPDYIINAGGFIHLALQIKNDNRADNETEISKIYERVLSFMGKTY